MWGFLPPASVPELDEEAVYEEGVLFTSFLAAILALILAAFEVRGAEDADSAVTVASSIAELGVILPNFLSKYMG